ncbi:MAG: DUF2318 domain-containing protein [Desulfobacterales bacterium]|nr:DUF2318 domain-containing protein [Desulfobacterales bacterium]
MAKKPKTKKASQTENNANDLRARKKAAVMATSKKKEGYLLPTVIAVLVVAAVAGGYMLIGNQSGTAPAAAVQAAPQTVPPATDNRVTYPVAMFADGKARHFDFKDGEHTIRYFVLKSADGVLRAAFDACDVCWPAGKGYYQEGDVMVCRNCNRRFVSTKVNEVKGGCNPAPLNRRVEGDMLVIEVDDIRSGRGYFDFKGRA